MISTADVAVTPDPYAEWYDSKLTPPPGLVALEAPYLRHNTKAKDALEAATEDIFIRHRHVSLTKKAVLCIRGLRRSHSDPYRDPVAHMVGICNYGTPEVLQDTASAELRNIFNMEPRHAGSLRPYPEETSWDTIPFPLDHHSLTNAFLIRFAKQSQAHTLLGYAQILLAPYRMGIAMVPLRADGFSETRTLSPWEFVSVELSHLWEYAVHQGLASDEFVDRSIASSWKSGSVTNLALAAAAAERRSRSEW